MAFVNLNNSLNELKRFSQFAAIWQKFLCRCILPATLFIVFEFEYCVHFYLSWQQGILLFLNLNLVFFFIFENEQRKSNK